MTHPESTTSALCSFVGGSAVERYGSEDTAKLVNPVLKSVMTRAVQASIARPNFVSPSSYHRFGLLASEELLQKFGDPFANEWYADWLQREQQLIITAKTELELLRSSESTPLSVDEISDILLRQYLRSLEEDASGDNSEFPPHISLPATTRIMDNVSDIGREEWDRAWTGEFRGNVLKKLEAKLRLNVHAVTKDVGKETMSRIIPVVQSSGTGKSRLAEE
jgi:hypothetical protein